MKLGDAAHTGARKLTLGEGTASMAIGADFGTGSGCGGLGNVCGILPDARRR
jgi:hypothetical protein